MTTKKRGGARWNGGGGLDRGGCRFFSVGLHIEGARARGGEGEAGVAGEESDTERRAREQAETDRREAEPRQGAVRRGELSSIHIAGLSSRL